MSYLSGRGGGTGEEHQDGTSSGSRGMGRES